MEDTDVLLRVKNSFMLGNFKNALDVWKEAVTSGISLSPKIEEQLTTFVLRLAVIFAKNNEKVLCASSR